MFLHYLSQICFVSISLADLFSEPQTSGAAKDQEISEEFFLAFKYSKIHTNFITISFTIVEVFEGNKNSYEISWPLKPLQALYPSNDTSTIIQKAGAMPAFLLCLTERGERTNFATVQEYE